MTGRMLIWSLLNDFIWDVVLLAQQISTTFCSVKSGSLRSLLCVASQLIPHAIWSYIKLSLRSLNSHVWALVLRSVTGQLFPCHVGCGCWTRVFLMWCFCVEYSTLRISPRFSLPCFCRQPLPMRTCCRLLECRAQLHVVISWLGYLTSFLLRPLAIENSSNYCFHFLHTSENIAAV